MTRTGKPSIRKLSPRESHALLARLEVGRIAYIRNDRPEIEPVHYVVDDEWICGRTSMGPKVFALAHHPWCTFEADEARGPFDWASVIVKGTFQMLDPELDASDAVERCLAQLRVRMPGTMTIDDPAPRRTILFRIHIDEITGRRADPATGATGARRALVVRARAGRQSWSASRPFDAS